MTAGDDLETVFDVSGVGIVRAPRSLALPVTKIWCVWKDTESFGAHIRVCGQTATVAYFPWWDNVDHALASLPDGWAPLASTTGEMWSDLDQGWWLSTVERDGWVYVFETDPDEFARNLTETPGGGCVAAAGDVPGTVLVGHVEATWFKIPSAEFRRAWSTAQAEARTRIHLPI